MVSYEDPVYDFQPELPLPISTVGERYLIFDVKVAFYLRRKHNICGMTVGTLPQSPSQNLFLGVPIEIMPEEAQVLIEHDVAYIVDDPRAHDQAIHSGRAERRADYLTRIQEQSRQVEHINSQRKQNARDAALAKVAAKNTGAKSKQVSQEPNLLAFGSSDDIVSGPASFSNDDASEGKMKQLSEVSPVKVVPTTAQSRGYQITPATSRLLLPPKSADGVKISVVGLPSSYPLYRHLHEKGYFMTPGLRFGCQYTVYPGDPLRFHSHFLAVGVQWDEEINLMDIVGGGRLGTGVKKGYLLGGQKPLGEVRTFSIEWAAM